MAKSKAAEKTVNPPPAKTEGVQQVADIKDVPMALAVNPAMPAWLQKKMEKQAPRGLEAADKDDFIYPRLILCQSNSKFVKDGDCEAGDIADNLTGEVLCKAGEELLVIPVLFNKSRLWLPPMEDGGPPLCRSADSVTAQAANGRMQDGETPTKNCAECIYKDWDDSEDAVKGGKPKCTLYHNFLVMLPEHGNRMVVLACKTVNVATSRRLLSICNTTGADLWAHRIAFHTVAAKSGAFDFHKYEFEQKGWATAEEYDAGEKLYSTLKGKAWTASDKDIEAEDAVDPVGSTDGEAEETGARDTDFPPAEQEAVKPPPPKTVVDSTAKKVEAKKPTSADNSGF